MIFRLLKSFKPEIQTELSGGFPQYSNGGEAKIMKNVYFVQVDISSNLGTKSAYLPYTAGILVANAWESEIVKNNCSFKEFIFLRENIDSVLERMDNPGIAAFSNYCWSTEYNKALARRIKEKYGVEDPEILSAIRWHTTGRPDMTMLEAIIFSADFIEPNRKPLICLPKIRSIIFSDMDMALCLILEQTLVHLEHKGQAIDEYSKQAAEYYRKKINERN